MLRLHDALLLLTCGPLLWGSSRAAPPSAGTSPSPSLSDPAHSRGLVGRFLHITDFHPDPFYKTYASTTADAACHRDHGPAGIYGAETSACDSPFALINQTFAWINKNLKDKVDFVIWTGDSARHDNDEAIPRTQDEIIRQNEFMVSKFAEVFGQSKKQGEAATQFAIPVVPTFGNNDIMPHNIFLEGPNQWTAKYLDIWRSFIPEAQRHQFHQGGWFSVEVIPGKLAVISLNTMYFFASNSGVDGCANKHEPGYEHMDWLRIQLQILRNRDMKAILMGHVPPARTDSKSSWDETCWQKYTLWQRQFRDIIVGNLYGHMNIDHFMLQDFHQISKDAEKGRMASSSPLGALEDTVALYEDGEVTVASASDYLLSLREAWSQLPSPPTKQGKKLLVHSGYEESRPSWWNSLFSNGKKTPGDSMRNSAKKKYLDKIGGRYAERYSVTHVAPSVVPNYFPTLRIIEYNISGLEHLSSAPLTGVNPSTDGWSQRVHVLGDDELTSEIEIAISKKKHKKSKSNKKGPRKYKFKVPPGPSKSTPPGPAYSPQPLTWIRTIQYFANLTRINNDFVGPEHNDHHQESRSRTRHDSRRRRSNDPTSPNAQAPYTIFGLLVSQDGGIEYNKWKEGKHHQHQGKRPRVKPHPNKFVFEIEYDTKQDYRFPDLTVRRWVEFARRIGQGGTASDTFREQEGDTPQIETGEDFEVGGLGGKKHEGKKGNNHKHKHHEASRDWFTFVTRAFVGTMDPRELDELFGEGASLKKTEHMDDAKGEGEEVIEL